MISENVTYEINSNSDKDLLIAQLKAELIEKEQRNETYLELQSKFRNLQNTYQLLCEEKLSLEYQLRGNSENENKSASEFELQRKNILNELNDKISMNKKLYTDNDNLCKIIQAKEKEDFTLRTQLNEQEELLSKLTNDKHNLQKQISSMNLSQRSHLSNIQQLKNELEHLHKVNIMKNQNIKDQNEKNQQVQKELYSQQNENNSIKHKLQSKQYTLSVSQNQLRCANNTILKMEQDINTLSNELSKNKSDLNNLQYDLNQEITIRETIDKNNQKLESMIKQRDIEIHKYSTENNELNIHVESMDNDLRKLTYDLDKYKHFIMILTEHNGKLTREIEHIIERDMNLKMMLNSSERIGMLAEQNKQIVKNSLNNLKSFLERADSNNSKIITITNTQQSSIK